MGGHLHSPWKGRWNQLGGTEGEREELEEVREEELELLKLLGCWTAGHQSETGGNVFDTKKLLYFYERIQYVNSGNCNICHKYFASKVKLNIHIQKTHTYGSEKQLRTYLCETCGKCLGQEVT